MFFVLSKQKRVKHKSFLKLFCLYNSKELKQFKVCKQQTKVVVNYLKQTVNQTSTQVVIYLK